MPLDLKELLQYEEDREEFEKTQRINMSLLNSTIKSENKNLLKMQGEFIPRSSYKTINNNKIFD